MHSRPKVVVAMEQPGQSGAVDAASVVGLPIAARFLKRGFEPHGHRQTMVFLAALRHDRITAAWLIDGPINGEC